jgi:hypothetical protein
MSSHSFPLPLCCLPAHSPSPTVCLPAYTAMHLWYTLHHYLAMQSLLCLRLVGSDADITPPASPSGAAPQPTSAQPALDTGATAAETPANAIDAPRPSTGAHTQFEGFPWACAIDLPKHEVYHVRSFFKKQRQCK